MMIHDDVSASYQGQYKIEITFNDGKRGIVDFSKYLDKGGVFDRFKDIRFFKNFKINEDLGVLTWQDEIDISPETLYAEATRTPLPDWMKKKERFQRTRQFSGRLIAVADFKRSTTKIKREINEKKENA